MRVLLILHGELESTWLLLRDLAVQAGPRPSLVVTVGCRVDQRQNGGPRLAIEGQGAGVEPLGES